MKTVIDAVNNLKGEISNVIVDKVSPDFLSIILCVDSCDEFESGTYHNYRRDHGCYLADYFKFICTVDEFNACVDELSAATWIDGISLEEWKAGMKNTVIDSHGNELEIGKVYEFSKDKLDWFFSKLIDVGSSKFYKYKTDNGFCNHIRECQSPLGTIKKAPVKLVDGKAYQFEYIAGKFIGIYSENGDIFYLSNSRTLNRNLATNIIPLVPETK